MTRSRSLQLLAATGLLLATVACEDGLRFGGGTNTGGSTPAPSPGDVAGLRAFGMLTSFVGESATVVIAELAVIQGSGSEARYAGGVRDPYIRVGETTIELLTGDVAGVFGIDSERDRGLVYVDGAPYTFGYTIVDSEGSAWDFEATLDSPAEPHTAEFQPELIYPAGEEVDLDLFDMSNGGAIAVVLERASQVTFSTFRYTGPSELDAAYTSLLDVQGPTYTIPGSAFADPGTYRVDVHNYAVARPGDAMLATTGELAGDSLFVVGRAFSLSLDVD